MSEPRASLTRSYFAGSASLFPRLAFCRTPWLRPRYGHRVPASRAEAFHLNSSCAAISRAFPRCCSTALVLPAHTPAHAVARCSCSCVAHVPARRRCLPLLAPASQCLLTLPPVHCRLHPHLPHLLARPSAQLWRHAEPHCTAHVYCPRAPPSCRHPAPARLPRAPPERLPSPRTAAPRSSWPHPAQPPLHPYVPGLGPRSRPASARVGRSPLGPPRWRPHLRAPRVRLQRPSRPSRLACCTPAGLAPAAPQLAPGAAAARSGRPAPEAVLPVGRKRRAAGKRKLRTRSGTLPRTCVQI
jgi:hypothetical protein